MEGRGYPIGYPMASGHPRKPGSQGAVMSAWSHRHGATASGCINRAVGGSVAVRIGARVVDELVERSARTGVVGGTSFVFGHAVEALTSPPHERIECLPVRALRP